MSYHFFAANTAGDYGRMFTVVAAHHIDARRVRLIYRLLRRAYGLPVASARSVVMSLLLIGTRSERTAVWPEELAA